EQPSPLVVLPSSHCSPGSTVPLPQRSSSSQVAEQPSPLVVLPSSHCSPGSTVPLPHRLTAPHDGVDSADTPSLLCVWTAQQYGSPGVRWATGRLVSGARAVPRKLNGPAA